MHTMTIPICFLLSLAGSLLFAVGFFRPNAVVHLEMITDAEDGGGPIRPAVGPTVVVVIDALRADLAARLPSLQTWCR